eukprot:103863-Alexandrium_andersonii.AAC.1
MDLIGPERRALAELWAASSCTLFFWEVADAAFFESANQIEAVAAGYARVPRSELFRAPESWARSLLSKPCRQYFGPCSQSDTTAEQMLAAWECSDAPLQLCWQMPAALCLLTTRKVWRTLGHPLLHCRNKRDLADMLVLLFGA